MLSEFYWIDAGQAQRVAIMARPRAGDWLEDEVAHWRRAGFEVVVSLLERDEVDDLGLGREAALCVQHGLAFLSFPIADRGVSDDAVSAMRFADEVCGSGRAVAIHCRAGIGRSSIMAAAILLRGGIDAEAALAEIARARRLPVPDTEAQRAWVLSLQ